MFGGILRSHLITDEANKSHKSREIERRIQVSRCWETQNQFYAAKIVSALRKSPKRSVLAWLQFENTSRSNAKANVFRVNERTLLNACGMLLLPLHHTFRLSLFQAWVGRGGIDLLRSIAEQRSLHPQTCGTSSANARLRTARRVYLIVLTWLRPAVC